MKIFHISDLHIGKQLKYYSLKESQEKVLGDIIKAAKNQRPDVIIIAGDIYDRSVPSGEAYEIFNDFLNGLAGLEEKIPVLIIAGNHDNAMRLHYASAFLEKQRIYVSVKPPENDEEHLKKIVLEDQYGKVNFYMLPFTKPGYVRWMFEEAEIVDYNRAIREIIAREKIDYSERNVLVAHQFFVSKDKEPEKSDSELSYISVGGIDSVEIEWVRKFDYVALGHIHGAQYIGEEHIRYSGTPLKYSVSEENHNKAITVVTMGEKGTENQYDSISLIADKDVRSVKGKIEDIMAMATEKNRFDYVSITLTDEDNIYRPRDILEEKYKNILEVKVENKRTQSKIENVDGDEKILNPLEAFREFYQEINGQPLSRDEEEFFLEVMNQAREELQ